MASLAVSAPSKVETKTSTFHIHCGGQLTSLGGARPLQRNTVKKLTSPWLTYEDLFLMALSGILVGGIRRGIRYSMDDYFWRLYTNFSEQSRELMDGHGCGLCSNGPSHEEVQYLELFAMFRYHGYTIRRPC